MDKLHTKSMKAKDHVRDLKATFNIFRKCNTQLPKKCLFRVSSKKFLGFMVTKRGIEINLEKIQVII